MNFSVEKQLKNGQVGPKLILLMIIALALVIFSGCQSATTTEQSETTDAADTTATTETTQADVQPEATGTVPEMLTEIPTDRPLATIEMSDGQKIVLALYPEHAPNTVNNFIELAESEFYNGLIFHRVINGFMIQGGDPQGVGVGGPGYGIPGEFKDNGYDNPINHRPGIISMARSGDPNSAGSQFFICHGETSFLDAQYAAFGQVVTGQEVVDAIAAVTTDSNDKPAVDVVMKSITIDRQGYTFEVVEKN